jgi:uncharacterized protein (TIGR02118 family)
MYRLVATYSHPQDPEAFLDHYYNVHAPIGRRLPNVVSYTFGVCEMPDGSQPEFFFAAVLDWPTKELAQEDLASPVGQEGMADFANFAQAGLSQVFYEL